MHNLISNDSLHIFPFWLFTRILAKNYYLLKRTKWKSDLFQIDAMNVLTLNNWTNIFGFYIRPWHFSFRLLLSLWSSFSFLFFFQVCVFVWCCCCFFFFFHFRKSFILCYMFIWNYSASSVICLQGQKIDSILMVYAFWNIIWIGRTFRLRLKIQCCTDVLALLFRWNADENGETGAKHPPANQSRFGVLGRTIDAIQLAIQNAHKSVQTLGKCSSLREKKNTFQ